MNRTQSIFLALVAVIIIALAVYFFRTNSGAIISDEGSSTVAALLSSAVLPAPTTVATDSVSLPSASSVSAATAAPQTVNPLTANWIVFDNDEYDISARYPDDWYLYDALPLGGAAEFSSIPESNYNMVGSLPLGGAEIMIYRSPETLDAALSEDALGATIGSSSVITVNGMQATEFNYTVSSGSTSEQDDTVYIVNDGYVYRIILRYEGQPQFANTFHEFLSTLQFI